MCFVQDKTCTFFLPLSVITQVINILNGIWRHHLLSNKVGQNSCSLILENNHCKFSVICVRSMNKYMYLSLCYFFPFFNPTPFVFLKDISCLSYECAYFSAKYSVQSMYKFGQTLFKQNKTFNLKFWPQLLMYQIDFCARHSVSLR